MNTSLQTTMIFVYKQFTSVFDCVEREKAENRDSSQIMNEGGVWNTNETNDINLYCLMLQLMI